jgi:hypothetical protein
MADSTGSELPPPHVVRISGRRCIVVVLVHASHVAIITMTDAACAEMDSAHLDGGQSRRFVKDFIETMDRSMNRGVSDADRGRQGRPR